MELKQLSYFLCVAEAGSFSKAAVLMSVAQPVLSRQMKLLETELGVELFYRNGRGVVLSEAGKLLDAHARTVMQSLHLARTEITATRSKPQGRVVIAMPPSIGWVLTAALVRRCRAEFPDINLHVVEGFSGHVTEWLSTGRIDIGVVYNAPRRPTLTTEPLFADELVLLGPTHDPAQIGPCRPHRTRSRCDDDDAQSRRAGRGLYDPFGDGGPASPRRRTHPLLADRRSRDHPPAHARNLDAASDERGDPHRHPHDPRAGEIRLPANSAACARAGTTDADSLI